jgi:hypothetical protein
LRTAPRAAQFAAAFGRRFEQLQRDAFRGAPTDARKSRELLDEMSNGIGIVHEEKDEG